VVQTHRLTKQQNVFAVVVVVVVVVVLVVVAARDEHRDSAISTPTTRKLASRKERARKIGCPLASASPAHETLTSRNPSAAAQR
jgi:hypothetical protein